MGPTFVVGCMGRYKFRRAWWRIKMHTDVFLVNNYTHTRSTLLQRSDLSDVGPTLKQRCADVYFLCSVILVIGRKSGLSFIKRRQYETPCSAYLVGY